MSINIAESLCIWGVNPQEAHLLNRLSFIQQKEYLTRELETYVNHTLEDSAVSLPYYYQIGNDDNIYTYPSGIPLKIDQEERNGLYNVGVVDAVKLAMTKPNRLVFLYSPPGPVDFSNNPTNKYRQVKPYDRGQLNIMFYDGKKINNISVLVSGQQGEQWISEIMPDVYSSSTQQADEVSAISHLITHPQITNFDIDQFLNFSWKNLDRVIFTNRHNRRYSLSRVLSLIKISLSGQLKPTINSFDKTIQEMVRYEITEQFVLSLYQQTAFDFMRNRGLKQISMGGGCGGSIVKLSIFESINNFSSGNRELKQRFLLTNANSEKDDYFECPKCHGKIPSGQGIETCPHCHITKNEYAEQAGEKCI